MSDQLYKVGLGDPWLMVGEEGVEIAKESMKAQRFGLYGDPAWTGQPGNKPPRENIIQEIGDLLYVVDALIARGDLKKSELDAAISLKHQKMVKLYGVQAVAQWMTNVEPTLRDAD